MANYLARIAGRIQEVVGLVASTGAADAAKLVQTDASGRIDSTLMPVGIGADTYSGTASGALSAGDFVAVTATGVVRASAAATGVQADGFVLVASVNGASALVYFEGTNTALTGLTVGSRYYLSDSVPGGVSTAAVTGAGKLHQFVGKAITTTSLSFEGDDAIILA